MDVVMPAVFRAISDPTRRSILDLLREGERAVNDLLSRFQMTQPAVSQHLKVLREADLVRERRSGRQRFYSLHAAPLRDVYDWVGHYEKFWAEKFTALGDVLDELASEESSKSARAKSAGSAAHPSRRTKKRKGDR